MSLRSLFATLALVVAGPALAHSYTLGALEIVHPHIPAAIGRALTAAGFLEITNTGTEPDALIGVETTFAKHAEVHESKVDSAGVASMAHVERIDLAPGATVVLEHGGYHVMFMGVTEPPVEGMIVPVTLIFEKAGRIDVEFMVEPRKGQGGHSAGHGGHGGAQAPSN